MVKLTKEAGHDPEEYILKCEEILDYDEMDWCWETVDSIMEWVKKRGYITPKQARAIDNFYARFKELEDHVPGSLDDIYGDDDIPF